MASYRLVFRVHAIRRRFQRRFNVEDVRHVLSTGEVIENYPDDIPFPNRLVLGWSGVRPLLVVAADNSVAQETIVITIYEPNPTEWQPDFKRRRP